MATIVVKTIGTASRDYTTMATWEAAAPANLVTSDQVWKGELYPEGGGTNGEWTLTAELLLTGSTSDATRYKWLTTAAGQSFADHANKATNALRYNRANGVAIQATANYQTALQLNESNARLTRLQVNRLDASGTCVAVYSSSQLNTLVDQCIVRSADSAVAVVNITRIYNSLIYKRNAGAAITMFEAGSVRNCTLYGNGSDSGINSAYSSSLILKNTAIFNFANDVATDAHWSSGSSGNNATNLSAIIGSSNQVSLTASAQFESLTADSEDFRAKASGSLDTNGVRDQTYTNDVDIVSRARSTTVPTIGAWEVIAGGGTTDGAGSAAGSGAATGVGAALRAAVAAAAGAGTETGTGSALASAVGAASGTGTASAGGQSTAAAVGTATGSGTATGTGSALIAAAGAAAGSGSATGAGAATARAVGAAAGSGAASATGRATAATVGSASGAATVAGIADSALAQAVGSAAGSGAAAAIGAATSLATGTASGTGTAAGLGASGVAAVGAVSGQGVASGVGAAKAAAVGSSTGNATATATGRSTAAAVGVSTGSATVAGFAPGAGSVGVVSGIATATGIGAAIAAGVGTAVAGATATGVGASIAAAAGTAAGIATATGAGAAVAASVGSAVGVSTAAGIAPTLGSLAHCAHITATVRDATVTASARFAEVIESRRSATVTEVECEDAT